MNSILQSRITPHTLPAGIIKRERLLIRISENLEKSLILICAPAGYGKTTLIQDFLRNTETKSAWLHVHADMDNFYTFITYLTRSIERLNSEFGKGTLALVDDYRERYELSKSSGKIITDITSTFLNEFSNCFSDDVIIVIDDLGNIKNSNWIAQTFNTIFENIPTNLHFLITSREIPDFTLSVLQAKRNILKIESNDLSFKNEEIRELLSNYYKINSSEDEIQILKDNLSGWITGIHLILQSYGSDYAKLRLDKIIIFDDIFNYFTEDIFNDLETEIQDFLLTTSMLESFSAGQCDTLLDISNSRKIINILLTKNIFIKIDPVSPGDDEQRYSYQILFKRFLNNKLTELRTKNEINSFARSVSKYFLKKKDYINAINYALSAHDTGSATELIKTHFQSYFDAGNFEAIWNWLEKLDETAGNDVTEKDKEFVYYKGLLMNFYKGNIEKSMPYIDSAIDIAKKDKDNEFLIKCYISKSRNLISLGRVSEAINTLKDVLKIKTSSENKARILYLNAYAYYQNSDYDKSLQLLDKAITELDNTIQLEAAKDIQLDIYNLYGHIYLIRGDHSKSISYYEQVVKKADKIIDRYEALCNLVLLYSICGKFDKSLAYLNEAKEITDKISIPIFRITFLLASQALKFEFGDYEESIRLLEEMNDIALKLNHKFYIFLSYSLLGDSYYYLNKLSRCEEYYDLAFKYLNDDNKLEKIQYSVMKALLLKKTQLQPSIETILIEAYEFYDENKFIYNKILTAFHLADYYFLTKNLQTTARYLKEALEVSSGKEYTSYLQRDLTDSRGLFDFALANNIQKDFVKILIDSLMNKKETPWISGESRKRFEEISNSIYDVDLNLFSKGEVTVRGKVVGETQWSKKKWKLIFIYLMLSPKKVLTKDKIIDLFYADTSIESADNIFHQLISKFRNLIKISEDTEKDSGEKKRKSKKHASELNLIPNLVIYEDKILKMNSDLVYRADSDEFERYYKLSTTEKNHELKLGYLRKAADIYKGEFLEGNYETWCEELRTKYHSYFTATSETLIKILFEMEEYNEAINYSENLLKYDKLNLISYEYLIRAYEMIDKHKLARERYSQLLKQYHTEYGVSIPSSLNEKIKTVLS